MPRPLAFRMLTAQVRAFLIHTGCKMTARRISLSDLAHVAEIIAAVAVIVSLVYVARGLQDNTQAVNAAAVAAITSGSRESLLAAAIDGDLARIRSEGNADPSSLSAVDADRYFLYVRQLWLNFQNVWTQWKLGTVDQGVWLGYEAALCDILSSPGMRSEWGRHAPALDRDFVNLVEGCQQLTE